MTLPTGYELKKMLSDMSNVELQELKQAVEFEVIKRRDENREHYEKILAATLVHLHEDGFQIYAHDEPLSMDDIDIL